MKNCIRLGIVDDHPLMRDGIALTLGREGDFKVVACGGNAKEAVAIAEKHAPDIMLLDVKMPGGGFEAAQQITASHPDIRIVFLTVSESREDVSAALASGGAGYILKGIAGPDLVRAIRSVAAGETYITPQFAARLIGPVTRSPERAAAESKCQNLSAREEQILEAVARGLKNKEIACKLNISEKTVKHYMSAILAKLSARNRMEAVLASNRLKAGADL